jgi:hypothetical protein
MSLRARTTTAPGTGSHALGRGYGSFFRKPLVAFASSVASPFDPDQAKAKPRFTGLVSGG